MTETGLSELHRMFFDADEASRDERKEGEQARDYYDGKQYTAQELEVLAKRNQPPTTLNRVARKINHLAGIEVDRRTDPKALPRTTEHEKAAQAATDALRYVEETIKLDEIFTTVHDNMLVEGYGALELSVVEKNKGGQPSNEIECVSWKWDRLFYDPHSVLHDFSDARYLGGVEWLDHTTAVERFPDKKDILDTTKGSHGTSATDEYEDQPEKKSWVTMGARKRLRIVHMYYISNGDWWLCQFTGSGVLRNRKVPFTDEEGKNFCPMFFQSAYVDRDGDRYGEVRNLISPQDMINKAHSKLQHLVQTRQILAEDGAVSEEHGGIDGARQELAKPDGVIIKNPDFGFEVLSTADMTQGHVGLLQEYKGEIDLMGPNASMQGKGPQSQSGRALIAQTEGGLREFGPVTDRTTSLKERVYRAIWNLVRQYWTEPKWIRVTDDEKGVRFVGLNQPKTRMELAEERMRERGATDDDIEGVRQQVNSHPIFSFEAQQIAEIENNVEEIDVDISIEAGPDIASIQSEQFAELTRLAPAMAQSGMPIPPKVLFMASSLRDKDKIIEMMEGNEDPAAAAQQQEQQDMQIRLQVEKALAEIEKEKSDAAKNFAAAEKAQAETLQIMESPVPA